MINNKKKLALKLALAGFFLFFGNNIALAYDHEETHPSSGCGYVQTLYTEYWGSPTQLNTYIEAEDFNPSQDIELVAIDLKVYDFPEGGANGTIDIVFLDDSYTEIFTINNQSLSEGSNIITLPETLQQNQNYYLKFTDASVQIQFDFQDWNNTTFFNGAITETEQTKDYCFDWFFNDIVSTSTTPTSTLEIGTSTTDISQWSCIEQTIDGLTYRTCTSPFLLFWFWALVLLFALLILKISF